MNKLDKFCSLVVLRYNIVWHTRSIVNDHIMELIVVSDMTLFSELSVRSLPQILGSFWLAGHSKWTQWNTWEGKKGCKFSFYKNATKYLDVEGLRNLKKYIKHKTMFHQDIQTPRRELKIWCTAEYFWQNSRCLDSPLPGVFDISFQSKQKLRSPRKNKIVY